MRTIQRGKDLDERAIRLASDLNSRTCMRHRKREAQLNKVVQVLCESEESSDDGAESSSDDEGVGLDDDEARKCALASEMTKQNKRFEARF